jgi:uncharacterized protein (DUF1330 family)
VLIEFPDVTAARAWYTSPAYREILTKRTDDVETDAILIEGVPAGYDRS